MGDTTTPTALNRAGRRAEARTTRRRKAGAALAAVPTAFGGAVAMDDGATLVIQDTTMTGNTAQYGGAVYAVRLDGPVRITRSTFTMNEATDGGAGALAIW